MTNLLNELRQFTGSETFTRNNINANLIYTEGIKFLAEEAQAYWMIDLVAAELKFHGTLKNEDFLTVSFKRDKEGTCKLVYDDGNYNVLFESGFEFSTFPLDEFSFYVCRNHLGGHTMLLKSEY